MQVINNDKIARYVVYKVNGQAKRVMIPGMTSVELPDLISTSQVLFNQFDLKVNKINFGLGRGILGDLTIGQAENTPPTGPSMKLTFNGVFPVADPTSVSDWNTFFVLPTNGTPFTSVEKSDNLITLYGGSNITLKASAFNANTNLLEIEDSTIVTLASSTFINCSGLTKAHLNALESSAMLQAFRNCINLANIKFESLEFIINSSNTFDNCIQLTSINSTQFPVLKSILGGSRIFSNNPNLTSFQLPTLEIFGGGTSVGNSAFFNCSSLTNVFLPACTSLSGAIFNAAVPLTTIDNSQFPVLNSLGNVVFANNTNITTVNLPLVTSLGLSCFFGNSSLTDVNLSAATNIGDSCFAAASLVNLNLSNCQNLGTTTGNDSVFFDIAGANVTLTIPTALMTCDGGNPDGDIVALQTDNTVTIIQV